MYGYVQLFFGTYDGVPKFTISHHGSIMVFINGALAYAL